MSTCKKGRFWDVMLCTKMAVVKPEELRKLQGRRCEKRADWQGCVKLSQDDNEANQIVAKMSLVVSLLYLC